MRKILLYASSRKFRIEEPLTLAGYHVVYIPEKGNKLFKFCEFVQITKKESPDLFLIDSVGLMCVSAYVLSLVFRIPFAVRIRANMWDVYEEQRLYLPFRKRVYRYCMLKICEVLFRKAHRVFPVSTALARLLVKKGVPEQNIRLLYYPIDHEKFRPLEKKEAEIGLISVTNLSFKAKFGALISILPHIDDILAEFSNVTYTIVGDGLFTYILKEELNKMDHADRVFYVGYQKNIEDVLGKSDIFLHFSQMDGFPAAVVEAMSCGLPVVANRYEAMVEQVDHGVTGFLVDESSLTGTLRLLITDEEIRKDMGHRARQHIVHEFNNEVIAESYKREIEDLMRELKK